MIDKNRCSTMFYIASYMALICASASAATTASSSSSTPPSSSSSAIPSLPFVPYSSNILEADPSPPWTRRRQAVLNYHRTKKTGMGGSTRDTSGLWIPRGGEITTAEGVNEGSTGGGTGTVQDIVTALTKYMQGSKSDALVLLTVTALNSPLSQKLQISPILGYLGLGLLTKTQGFVKDIHTTEMLADLGIVLFLFEMGLHLDLQTLLNMKRDVFGIGLGQFTITTLVISLFCANVLSFSKPASLVIGWSLALSSSAFVLQLLKDTQMTDTQYGRSTFGTLLLQDLMVVPLLVITPLLAGTGTATPLQALSRATIQIVMALVSIGLFGKFLLTPLLTIVTSSLDCQPSFIGLIFTIVLGCSFLTEGLGLSNTLGAFLSGMLIAGTPYRHKVEHQAEPFRAILVGIFFLTVGFEIDCSLLSKRPLAVLAATVSLLLCKTLLATLSCRLFGDLPFSISQRVGLVLSQGGEFAFVAFRTARGLGLLGEDETRFLLTCVALSMACTPALEGLGSSLEETLRKREVEVKEEDKMKEKKKIL